MSWNNQRQDLNNQLKVGLIHRKAVNKFLFTLVAGSILISVLMINFAIWDYVGREIASKTVATCATLIGGGILFSFINDYFGSKTISTEYPGDSQ